MPFSRESVNDYNNMAQMLNNAKRYQFYHYINSGDYYAPMTYSYGMYLPSKRSGATPIFVDPSPQFYLTEPISTRAFNYDDILNAAAAVASSSSSPTNSNTDESSSGTTFSQDPSDKRPTIFTTPIITRSLLHFQKCLKRKGIHEKSSGYYFFYRSVLIFFESVESSFFIGSRI